MTVTPPVENNLQQKSARALRPLPKEFILTDERIAWAQANADFTAAETAGIFAMFRTYMEANGVTAENWEAKWRNWLLREKVQYRTKQQKEATPTYGPQTTPLSRRAADAARPSLTPDDIAANDRLRAELGGALPHSGRPPAGGHRPNGVPRLPGPGEPG